MKILQKIWTEESEWVIKRDDGDVRPQIALVFGPPELLNEKTLGDVKTACSGARVVLCSTAGEILGNEFYDGAVTLTAVQFTKTQLEFAEAGVNSSADSAASGKILGAALPKDGLRHVMIFSDGLLINGTDLAKGVIEGLGSAEVTVTGGLAGDGLAFKSTLVGLDRVPESGRIVAVGFYGDNILVGSGSFGGWDPFGPDRLITKSKGNVLYELDGRPALELYKKYLGDKAKELPSSGLLFPLRLTLPSGGGTIHVVRTLLAVNEEEQSMTFAGDMPEGIHTNLMKANFEKLIDGAANSAARGLKTLDGREVDLAVLVSCVGRKLLLKERTAEEINAVRAVIGDRAAATGFYSYGELGPTEPDRVCRLHNQTMTVTVFREN